VTSLESVKNSKEIMTQDYTPKSRTALTQDGCPTAHNIQGAGPDSLPLLVPHHDLVHRIIHLYHDAPLR